MLVLSRKAGESIKIGDGVTVTLLEIKGSRIKLGIETEKGVKILRGELPKFDQQRRDGAE
jgi:carbon storage regulator